MNLKNPLKDKVVLVVDDEPDLNLRNICFPL